MSFIQLGWVSRVDEMILARERSGFAGKKVWDDIPVVPGECKGPRNQESRPRNQDSSRRTVNVEETSSKAMVAIDGAGFDWSFMAEEEVTTNIAFMAFSDSEVYNDKTCSNTYLKSFEALKTQLDNLRVEFNKSEFNLATYKRGLTYVEEQLVFYKKNVRRLRMKKKAIRLKLTNLKNASKSLDKLIGSQISNNNRKGVGYNAVPPPPAGLFAPLIIYLSYSGLEEFQQLEFEGYRPKASKSVCVDTSNEVKKTLAIPLVEELVVNYNYTTNMTHPNAQRNMVPRAVLMKTGLKPFNTARTVNTAHPKSTVFSAKPMSRFSKSVQSTVKRPYQSKIVLTNKRFTQKVNTAKVNVNTVRRKAVNTARPNSAVVNTIRANQENTVKASAYWVWRPTKLDSASITLKKHNYIDTRCPTNIVMAWSPKETNSLFLCEGNPPTDDQWLKVIIVKPHNKTPYELFRGRTPALNFMRLFGCLVSILNTLDHLGKFDGKSDDGFFVGYSLTSKVFRVYNMRTRRVEENLHIRFMEDKPIVSGNGPKWLFDIDSLTKSMNYVPVIADTISNDFASSEVSIGEGTTSKETNTIQDYIVMPLWKDSLLFDSPSMNVSHDEPVPSCDAEKKDDEGISKESGVHDQEKPESGTLNINTARPSINTASANLRTYSLHINTVSPIVLTTRSNFPQSVSDLFSLRDNVKPEATNADLFGDETKMDMSNLNASYHEEPKRVTKALSDSAWVEAMQEELLQFKLQKVWVLVDLPKRKRAIGTKWIFRNKKDERGIVIRNKARLVA
ncbi:putative ribonuclease H-like domain-containing protein [Tanacetum coccineum]|uniref:Ribonuclease H-like domain-containing protein n=1 Tax=Tanacetum coccineum TaxID=301880 RepID=A0ABQ5IWD5_9ASTR